MGNKNIVSEIAENELCMGCGICSGCCPSENLTMTYKENGDLAPQILGECPQRCEICLEICPFSYKANNANEIAQGLFSGIEGISRDDLLGYYLDTYVGYSITNGHRERGSSGGMATWLLEELIKNNLVDSVICVAKSESKDSFFAYRIFNKVDSIRDAAGSKYCPVEMSGVIKNILHEENPKRYAIVGLPCSLKALRSAAHKYPKLGYSIRYMLGLCCLQLPNRFYTEYLIRLSGLPVGQMKTINYRSKRGAERAGNFRFTAVSSSGKRGKELPYFGSVAHAFGSGYFKRKVCNYCEDVFAELADVTFMDAWLPEYESDPTGHSILIVRNPDINRLLKEGNKQKSCLLEQMPIDRVIESQRGAVESKKKQISGRLYYAKMLGEKTSRTEAMPSKEVYRKHRINTRSSYRIQDKSKQLWPRYRKKPPWLFAARMLPYSWPYFIKLLRIRLARLWREPRRMLKLLPGSIRTRILRNN